METTQIRSYLLVQFYFTFIIIFFKTRGRFQNLLRALGPIVEKLFKVENRGIIKAPNQEPALHSRAAPRKFWRKADKKKSNWLFSVSSQPCVKGSTESIARNIANNSEYSSTTLSPTLTHTHTGPVHKKTWCYLSGIQMVRLSGIQMAFKYQIIWHPTSIRPFEYRTSS